MESNATLNISGLTSSNRLLGKVALLIGGGGRIGVETASRFLREGANVTLVDIIPEALEVAVLSLKDAVLVQHSKTARILTIVADVTLEAEVEAYTKKTVQTFGRLDCVFLNAGISYRSIILTSSIAGLRGTPGLILYSGSKFALRGLALTAASELGSYGIRVNTIHPSVLTHTSGVDGPMFRNAWSPEKLEELKRCMPLGRFAQVDDVAGVVVFLASEDSKFMTGGFLKVDGGCVSF
ncbi:putative 2,5-dichloro-2,5-cyclohexadiene-1,4-diol dehydrogenase [Lophiotrema nucula]|uniref:Putative 2,5-dichloro-2,5-cyclohexadiene-1,4-diol dehydrogenase n=1 Tax=Lophiotrema nucula TaxID=690887 RepID=A0A6A5ZQR2_9PLEO|nr:putative 2,5-dichloro-2,5-cyclohexadiene-1,4-diol dehydrogenase [Lophiotrema nucula]